MTSSADEIDEIVTGIGRTISPEISEENKKKRLQCISCGKDFSPEEAEKVPSPGTNTIFITYQCPFCAHETIYQPVSPALPRTFRLVTPRERPLRTRELSSDTSSSDIEEPGDLPEEEE